MGAIMFVILEIYQQYTGIESKGLSPIYSPILAGAYTVCDAKIFY